MQLILWDLALSDDVLHCFQKQTQKARKADVDLAAKRYRDLVQELNR